MASFEISKKVKAEKELTVEQLKEFITEQLKKSCAYKVVSEEGGELKIKGRVRESLFTPVTKFHAVIEIKTEDDKARINITGQSGVNWVFWVFFLIGLVTGVFLLIGIGLYLLQRNKPKEMVESLVTAIDTEFGSF